MLISITLFVLSITVRAQIASDKITIVHGDTIYYEVETSPEFPGGPKALQKYLNSIRFSEEVLNSDIRGQVYVRFTVDKTGKVKNVEVVKTAVQKYLTVNG